MAGNVVASNLQIREFKGPGHQDLTSLIVSAPISFRHSSMASNMAFAFAILKALARRKRSKELSSSRLRISPSSVRMTRNLLSVSCCNCIKSSGWMLIASSSPLDEAPDCWLLEEAQWHRSWIITTDRRLRERDGRRHECRDGRKTREDETKSYEINSQISLSQTTDLKSILAQKFFAKRLITIVVSSLLHQKTASSIRTPPFVKTASSKECSFKNYVSRPQQKSKIPSHDFTLPFFLQHPNQAPR